MATKKKKTQDTSPLAMGRKQQGSAANKRASKTGSNKSSQSSVSQKERINQKSYGTTSPSATRRSSGTYNNSTGSSSRAVTNAEQRRQNTTNNLNLKQTQAQANRQRLEEDRIRREQESKARRAEAQYQKNTARPTEATAEQMRKQQEAARQQKMGLNSMATAEQQTAANRALKNTPSVVKESAKQAAIGHGKTAADVTELNKSSAIGSKIDIKSEQFQKDIEKRRKASTAAAATAYDELSKAQEKSEAKVQNRTKNAKGLEKAYYGAVESGTGMLTDIVIGGGTQAGALAAMGSRVYGNARGQAQKEGATEKEDRLYSLAQAGKEVGTELMFPGAGLARKAYGRVGLPLAEVGANVLTKRLRGKAADIVSAGLRLSGGVAEENLEEIAGWGLDPLIKEATYGKNVRERRKADLLQGVPEFENREEAESAAAYLSSGFIEDTQNALVEQGMSEKAAKDYAEKLRDFYSAYYSGDEETMDKIAGQLSGTEKKWDLTELRDTIASTTLLTGVTGLPGTVTTTSRGAAIRNELGDEGVRSLVNFAVDFEDKNASMQAEVARDRLDSGKELTATQVYDLAVAQMEQDAVDIERVKTAQSAAASKMEQENLVEPYIVRADGLPVMGEATRSAYSEAETDAKQILEGKESITEEQIDDGARAIAGFQTGVFTVNDANALNYSNTEIREAFSEATGVDLDQYIVKDKSGNVDIPATNTATKDALFAMASDNLVKSAQAETANWMDNVKGEVVTQVTSRMGGKGSVALQAALDDVDERNRSEYMMTANAADMMYQQGRNIGAEWDTIKNEAKALFPSLSEDKLRSMYEAGLEDREIANNKAIGMQAQMGEKISAKGERTVPGGKVIVETEAQPKGTEIRLFSEIADQLGADIHLVDEIVDKEGNVVNRANGSYDPKTNSFYINLTTGVEQNIGYIFMHECTHYLKVNAPEQYQELENLVREKWFSANPEQMQNAIARKIEAYSEVGKLTEEQALEEIIADAAHEFINDPNFAEQVAEENPSLAKALLDSIRNVLRKLREILSSGSIEDETHMNSLFSELGIFDEAERIWLNAYTQAVKNRADQAINDWQDAVNAESRLSLADTHDYIINRKDSSARWTDDRIDRLIKEYGASNPDYSQAYAVMMNPRDFLKLTLRDHFLDSWNEGANSEEHPEVYSLNEEELRNNTQTPFLSIHSNDSTVHVVARVDGHEGRHRMRALMEAGVTSVPVVIQDMDTKYTKKPESWMLLGSQNFGDGPVNNKATVDLSDLVPIKESNRDELIQKFGGEADVRFSISDADYMDAVERGDMETAQRMVDEAAENAGYTIKVFHGTPNGGRFNVFDPKKLNNTKMSSHIGQGFYFTNSREGAEEYTSNFDAYGNVSKGKDPYLYEGYLKLQNPIEITENSHNLSYDQIRAIIADGNKDWFFDRGIAQTLQNKDINGKSYSKDEILGMDRDKKIDLYSEYLSRYGDMAALSNMVDAYAFDKQEDLLVAMQEHTGHDGIHWQMREGLDQYVVFDSSQFKESAPATYDDNGDVIPLSERFNQETPDIRYSISESIGEDEPLGVETESSKGNSVDVRYSIPTEINVHIKGDGRLTSVRLMRDGFMKGRGKEKKAVNAFIDMLGDHMTAAADLFTYVSLSDVQNATVTYRRDADGNPTSVIMSCQVQNGEYEINYDFSTICKKRKAFQDVIEQLFKRTDIDTLDLTEENIFEINKALESYGFEIACPICFVEARRYANKEYADKIISTWNAEVEKVNPDAGYFDFANADTSKYDYEAIDTALKNAKMTDKMDFADKCRVLVNSGEVFQKKMQQSDILTNQGVAGMKAMSNENNSLFGYMKQSRGASAPKEIVSFNAYNGEIEALKDTYKDMPLADFLYTIGGARLQSFSDFQIENVYDYIQLIAGMASRKLPAHAYTKEVAFAKLFGMTGMKINLSLVCDVDPNVDKEHAGLKKDKDGKWVYNLGSQSFKLEDARELQSDPRYAKNVGSIMVGMSDEHITMALNDSDVRFVIPYHKSGLPGVIQDSTHLDMAKDYTAYQNTCELSAKGIKKLQNAGKETSIKAVYEANGKDVKKTMKALNKMLSDVEYSSADVRKATKLYTNSKGQVAEKKLSSTGDFNVYDDVAKTKNPRKTAENYMAYCFENNYLPLFFQFAENKNYYKMIFDFNMYDCVTEKYAPQGAVKNIYPGLDLTKGESDYTELLGLIDGYLNERNEFYKEQSPKFNDVITEIKSNILTDLNQREEADTKWSLSDKAADMDELYMSAVNSGNMEEAQRLVDDAAKSAGYDTPKLYHGTPSFGFTEFDLSKGENIIFATNSRLTAETYSGGTERERISDASTINVDELYGDNLLREASKHRKKYNDYRLMSPAEQESLLEESRKDIKRFAQKASDFIDDHKDAFNDEKLEIANRIVDALNRISTAWADDMVDSAWNDFEDAVWDLKWMDETIQMELSKELQENGSLLFAKNRVSDFMYAGDLYRHKDYESDYVFDNQLALELGADLGKGIYGLYGRTANQLVIDAEGSNWNQIKPPEELKLYGPQKTRWIAEAAMKKGYDSVLFKNLRDNGGETAYNGESDVYMFFNPSQVKSADPVTYAEDGSVIPLSERFNPDNNDIRYSLPTQDSDNNILSDGQMEYFKNSQARDEQGRLLRVYHGTMAGPRITNFSNDSRAYWFSPNEEAIEMYSMGDEYGIPGSTLPTERNPYDSDEEYFAKMGIRFEENDDGEWEAIRTDNVGREHTYDYAYETKEELISQLYDDSESGYLSDSRFELRNFYPCYLNLTNPMIIECDGTDWDDINGTGMSTNDYVAEARHSGYDGVIFRNVVDPFENIDVYVAFSSNQIKDIRNTDPTENPDIRYSITDDEESKSRIAYEDAVDNSYEALERYENLIDMVDPETYHIPAFQEDKLAEFYSSLKADETVPSEDPVLEEDRVRMAKSKADFYNSLNAKWQDRWTTGGEVLDVKSVKADIRNLVIGIMNNSDTSAKYRNDIVKKTLMDVRTAFQLMKQDRSDIASYLLYHSAQRMIDNVEFYTDETFDMYKDLKHYLSTTKISLGEEYWSDVDYNAFRRRNFGRLKLVKGETNVDEIYQELQEKYPEWFDEDETMTPPDQLLEIEHVLDSIQPYKEAYSSEAAAELAFDIADELYDIMAGGKEVRSLADTYKERYDAKTKAMKQRHAEAMLRMRKARDEGVQAERAKWRAKEEKRKERTAHSMYFDRIKKTYDKLTDRLLSNTQDKHIPEQYKKELAGLLAAFDFQTVRSKNIEEKRGYKAQKTIKLESMRTALERLDKDEAQTFHINDSITDIINDLLGLNDEGVQESIEGKALDELSASELSKIDKLLRSLLHEFNNYEKVRIGTKKQQAADIGHAQNDISLEHAETLGEGKDYQTSFLQGIDRLINLDMMTPAYLFRKIDPNNEGLGLMWKEIRRSFDKYVKNTEQLNNWMEEIVGKYHDKGILWNKYGSGELSKWRSSNFARTFNLTNGTIQLTPAQMMSVYCLAKRGQAYDHMVGAGIVVAPVSFEAKIMSDVKQKINKSLPVILNDVDIKTIVGELTPDQVKVADQLQELMATKMAAWGNEASMNVIGINLFEDPDYFPIRSDRAGLTKDLDPNQFEQAIRNFGFTKAVQPGARNAIIIDDIFDVVTEHCNNMNLYNAYTEAMNDFMKVYNYREFREEGEYTVEQALRHAFSDKAPMFIMQFLRDLNGNVSGRTSGIQNMYNALLSNAKKASVFVNARVAVQQPTAISRAFYVIDSKYMKGIRITPGAMKEMFEHCPIALWKSWGYYDINMGKSIEDVIMNNGNWLEDKATDLYGKLDNVTWTAIWQMVKAETKDTHPDVKEGTDEYWDLCNERMSEIVDLTQVVDSPMHRSHAMRAKDIVHKTATAFMAEPTLTYNMLRDGISRTQEAGKRKNFKLASQILTRTIAVYLLQCTMVAGAQSIIDALRGKNPGGGDDDDDESLQHLFWVNFLENWKDEFNPLGKIYFVKDIKSMMEGWENRNLALQGVYYLSLGYRQLMGDKYARSSKSWYENIAYGLGYLTGIPFKTMMTGISNAMRLAGIESPALHSYGEYLDSLAKEPEDSESGVADTTSTIGKLFSLIDGDSTLLKKSSGKSGGEKESDKESADKEADARAKAESDRDELRKLEEKARKKAAGLSGDELDEALWDVLGDGYTKKLDEADMDYIEHLELIYMNCGGDISKFDARIKDRIDTAYKKTLKDEMTTEDYDNQYTMRLYLQKYGYTDDEISDIVYHTYARSDLQAAMRMGNQQFIEEEATKLMLAGMSEADFEKAYKNRNRGRKTYKGKYADEKYLKSTGTYVWPAQGPITSEFGYRNAPTAGASSNHPAIDIGAAYGSPVVAADGGTVVSVGWNGGYGNQVAVASDDGKTVLYYSHLSDWNVNVGDRVSQGAQIAQVGSTGNSTGPHLDFKVEVNGEPVNPMEYLSSDNAQYALDA